MMISKAHFFQVYQAIDVTFALQSCDVCLCSYTLINLQLARNLL